MPTPPSDRALRIAANESRFRDINHRLAGDVRALARDDELLGFVCECGHPDCAAELPLSLAEYARVRSDPMHFAVLAGHEIADVEDVVARGERFVVVRKHESTRPIAEDTHPGTGS